MDSNLVTPSSSPPATVCTCAVPVPHVKAASKGIARTYCVRCGLPTRIAFESR